MRAPLAVLLALALAAPSPAARPASDLEVHFTQDRWARLRANPRRPTEVRRGTREFHQVLRPRDHHWVPTGNDRTLFPGMDRWGDRDNTDAAGRPQADGPRVLQRVAAARSLWLCWQLFKVPPGARIQRAELHMGMAVGDMDRELADPARVRYAPSSPVPGRLRRGLAAARLTGPAVRVRHDYPDMWWDVTPFARVAQEPGQNFRSLTLAIENAGHLTGRRPELHVWYTLALDATAE